MQILFAELLCNVGFHFAQMDAQPASAFNIEVIVAEFLNGVYFIFGIHFCLSAFNVKLLR